MAKGKEAKAELPVWQHFDRRQYEEQIKRLVHLSGKSVNTNSWECGVRLARGARLDLPYVSVSTLGAERVGLDYTKNDTKNKTASISTQAVAVFNGTVREQYHDVSEADEQMIRGLAHLCADAAYVGEPAVDMRLRQILIPVGPADDYVALTPLQSSGLSALLAERLRAEGGRRQTAVLGIGGSKPYNAGIGRQVRQMRPLVFDAPGADPVVRAAYAIYYKGIRLTPSRKALNNYAQWLQAQARAGADGPIRTNAKVCAEERKHIECIALSVLDRAARARSILQKAQLFDGRISSQLDPLVQGLFDAEARTHEWAGLLASRLLGEMSRHARLGKLLSGSALGMLRPEMESVIRKWSHE